MSKCRKDLVLVSAFINAYDVGGISTGQLEMLARRCGYTVRCMGPSMYEIRGMARFSPAILARPLPNRSMELTDISSPPAAAERVLACLLPPDRIEEALGDAEEAYHLMALRQGIRFARFWYRWQIAVIVARGALNGACRAIKIWSGVGPA